LLVDAGIPAAPLVAWGVLTDGRSFTIWQDLAGFTPGDKLVEQGTAFESVLAPTAELAAKLHTAGLHHRDLYLCHFMIDPALLAAAGHVPAVQLIDTARVRRLPGWPLRRRWIVKDLSQFWYSTTKLAVTDDQRDRWLAIYAKERAVRPGSLRGSIVRKARAIRRHDASLNASQPSRNVSIPT
jgi:Lipopolysaccharide kinase (Kdo/WaaP) family